VSEPLRIDPPPAKPTLLWDGDCGFCKRQAEKLRSETITLIPYQERPEPFKAISDEALSKSVYFIDDDGSVCNGAEAIYRARKAAKGKKAALWLYQRCRLFRWLSTKSYALVARNRNLFGKIF